MGFGRTQLVRVLVFLRYRGVEVLIFVFRIPFLVGVEIRLDVVEYDMSLSVGYVSEGLEERNIYARV